MPRLHGWKDIAAYLERSPRTAQRWERDYALPVHRLGREGGEIIWAESEEVDSWLRERDLSQPAPAAAAGPPQPASEPAASPERELAASAGVSPSIPIERQASGPLRARRGLFVWVAASAAVVLLLASPFVREARTQRTGPSDWRIAGGRFEALAADGRVLWTRGFGAPLNRDAFVNTERPGSGLLFHDLDGDGANEVLLRIDDRDNPESAGFYLINPDGTDRAGRVRPTGSVGFGEEQWDGPWFPHRLWVIRDAELGPVIYASFIHLRYYPTLLLQLDIDGRERGRYWSNGYIRTVNHARYGEQAVVLVGATNNDTGGGSLAILPRDLLRGAPPAVNPAYRCTSCGDDLPIEFLIFPRRCLARAEAGQPDVADVRAEDGGRLLVYVTEGTANRPTDERGGGVWYTLRPDLSLQSVLITNGLVIEHRAQFATGAIDHPLGDQDHADLFPVLRWTPSGFVRLTPAPVKVAGS